MSTHQIKNKSYEAYTLEYLAQKSDSVNNYLFNFKKNLASQKEKTWEDAYKLAAYYFDHPSQKQRDTTFRKVRSEFGNLINNEIPNVNSRDALLNFFCVKHNESLAQDGKETFTCNPEQLKRTYGPNEKLIEKMFESEFKLKY